MDYLLYLLFRGFVIIFRVIPFGMLFGFSNFFYFLAFHVTGYRKKVVYANLRNSFPEKSGEEIEAIARGFYHHFADMLVESLKAFTMPEQEVVSRYRFHNTGFLEELYREGKPVIVVAGHYGNWEWAGIAAGTQMLHIPVGFYKPLTNRHIDKYIRKTRVRGRSRLASITRTAETFKTDYGGPAAFYMVADQSPSSNRLAYWVDFMNQDTAALHGPEKYARLSGFPVAFAVARKVKRGRYDVFFTMLEPEPGKTKTGEITHRFMKMLEEEIRRAPQYYLWSHRRWKLSRPESVK
jgi:KDO2-lipid IV(A) lauroyltransferase